MDRSKREPVIEGDVVRCVNRNPDGRRELFSKIGTVVYVGEDGSLAVNFPGFEGHGFIVEGGGYISSTCGWWLYPGDTELVERSSVDTPDLPTDADFAALLGF